MPIPPLNSVQVSSYSHAAREKLKSVARVVQTGPRHQILLFLRCFYFLPPEQIESVREFILSMDGDSQKRCRGEIMMKFKLKGDQVKVPSETLLDFTPRQNGSIQTRQN
jgi:hypothetical protein